LLRLQRERMNGSFVPSSSEYFHYFGLDQKKLAYAKPDALVMHPGPMNRGVEIDSIVADGAQSLIREQVEMEWQCGWQCSKRWPATCPMFKTMLTDRRPILLANAQRD